MILISKTDLISSAEREELTAILRGLNTEAEILPIVMGQAPLTKILNTGRFDFDRAAQAPGWLKELRGERVPETENMASPRPLTRRAGRSTPSVSSPSSTASGSMVACCVPKAISGWPANTRKPAAGRRPVA